MPTSKNRITFQASDELKDALEAYSKDREQSVSSLIVGILRDFLVEEGYLESPKKQKSQRDRKT